MGQFGSISLSVLWNKLPGLIPEAGRVRGTRFSPECVFWARGHGEGGCGQVGCGPVFAGPGVGTQGVARVRSLPSPAVELLWWRKVLTFLGELVPGGNGSFLLTPFSCLPHWWQREPTKIPWVSALTSVLLEHSFCPLLLLVAFPWCVFCFSSMS